MCDTCITTMMDLPSSTDSEEKLHHCIRLDRRRFESAHLKYAVLMTQNRYPTIGVGPIPMYTDIYITTTLEKYTPHFFEAFCQRYSGTVRMWYIVC